ncbi:DUF805 domain-containing protein [Actinobacillus vicugnae]|uniref:DUF805 domain-containing protein n=1 Tax=Actinobacillus vicugnae TaxID=2573093 RepID=UPI001240B8B3|nr:DUF805 domain-containing protein [Actinobacillus vicugnae]
MNWFLHSLKNTFNFNGRARRREYGWFVLINMLIGLVVGLLAGVASALGLESLASGLDILFVLYQLVISITSISLAARRLHDLGWSGWWQLFPYALLIVFVLASLFAIDVELGGTISALESTLYIFTLVIVIGALIFSLILMFKDGQRFANKYGEDPKAVKNETEVTNSLSV